jgi:DNA-binding ferritin-like protein
MRSPKREEDRRHDPALSRPDHPFAANLLCDDNKQLAEHMRQTYALCDEQDDVASASVLEIWIDESERRSWFLFEASRRG